MSFYSPNTTTKCLYACVCVCVCERERECVGEEEGPAGIHKENY